jgi:hypothetical protein
MQFLLWCFIVSGSISIIPALAEFNKTGSGFKMFIKWCTSTFWGIWWACVVLILIALFNNKIFKEK